MDLDKINDLAFDFVENRYTNTTSYQNIKDFFIDNNGNESEIEYFLVFIKHWLDNKYCLQWSNIIMDSQYDY